MPSILKFIFLFNRLPVREVAAEKPSSKKALNKVKIDISANVARNERGKTVLSCSLCHKLFQSSKNLKRHLRNHTGEKPYKCSLCTKTFSRAYDLKKHAQTQTEEKLYNCNVCKKSFSDISYLKKHLRIHTGEKPFNCSLCTKSFALSHDLTKHTRCHTGEKPYCCSFCFKSFCNAQHLKKHLRTHTKLKVANNLQHKSKKKIIITKKMSLTEMEARNCVIFISCLGSIQSLPLTNCVSNSTLHKR